MKKAIKINFILPFKPRRPAGGFRVMYEYANRLARLGYKVHLTYPIKTQHMSYRLPFYARYALSLIEGFSTNKWFDFDPSITMSYVPEIKNSHIIDADIVITTWWSTVLEMGALSPRKGKKINLIQGFENWEGHEDLLFKSYDMKDTTNIVVASYLEEKVRQHTSNSIILIESGIDSNKFNIKIKPEDRGSATVAMNYSSQEIKGSKYGLEALRIVKNKVPDLQVELFSVNPNPGELPYWIKYHRNPKDISETYNGNAIFISNSFTEGFGLVSVESMFCGCALICTNIDGHKEYAFDKETALLVEPANAQQMAGSIMQLINNDQERIAMAYKGNEYVQRFSWDSAVRKMIRTIDSLLQ